MGAKVDLVKRKRPAARMQKYGLQILGSSVLFLLGYGTMLIPHYSIDSYSVAIDQMCMYRSGGGAGRLMFMLWPKLCIACGFNMVRQQWLGTTLLLLGCVFCHVFLYTAVRRYVCREPSGRKAAVLFCSLAVAFCNPFLVEWFQYVETTPIYSVCLCLAVTGAVLLLRNKRWDWLWALLCLLVAVTGYQVVISIFLILSAVLLLAKYDYRPTRKVFWEMVRCVAITGAAGISSLAWARLLPAKVGLAPRFSEGSLIDNLRFVLSIQELMWRNTLNILPGYIVAGFLFFCVVIALIPFVMKKDWIRILWTGCVLAGCAATVFLPYLVNGEHWVTTRASVQLFSFVAGAAVIAVLNAEKLRAQMLHILSVLFLAILVVRINQITADQLRTNRYDQAECDAIVRVIEQYEQDTGITVTGIAFSTDVQPTSYYPGIRRHWAELNLRAMTVHWGVQDVICFYTGKSLANRGVMKPPEFENQNWDTFDPAQQIRFDGETVCFCAF